MANVISRVGKKIGDVLSGGYRSIQEYDASEAERLSKIVPTGPGPGATYDTQGNLVSGGVGGGGAGEEGAYFFKGGTSGGGGSAAEAERKRRELLRLQEEKRRQQELARLEAERKKSGEKAFGGTVSGQIAQAKSTYLSNLGAATTTEGRSQAKQTYEQNIARAKYGGSSSSIVAFGSGASAGQMVISEPVTSGFSESITLPSSGGPTGETFISGLSFSNVINNSTNNKGTFVPGFGEGGGYLLSGNLPYEQKGTGIFRPITPAEKEQQIKADIKGSALWSSLPVVSQVKFFNYPFTTEQEKEYYTEAGPIDFLNPSFHYKIATEQEQLRYDILESRKIEKKVEKYKSDLLKSGVSEEELKSGTITSNLTAKQEDALRAYNAVVNYAISQPSTISLGKERRTTMDVIAQSGLSPTKRVALAASVKAVQIAPYFVAPTRALLGIDTAFEGYKAYGLAETTGEKALAGGQVALGGLLAYSGAKGTYNIITGTTGGAVITGSAAKLKTIKVLTYTGGTALAGGLGYLEYSQTLKRTEDPYTALGAGIGTGGTILAGLYGPKVYEKASDYWNVLGKEQLKTPGLESKPFIRRTISGQQQLVFYERAGKTKWYNPSSWKYRGYKPGQFFNRQYRLIDPLVEGKMGGLGEVSYYDVINGKVVKVTKPTTLFPYDDPSTHLDWFTGKKGGVEQYYIPKKFLPEFVKGGTEGMGYSATGTKWVENNPLLNEYQVYYSGKGASAYFFRTGAGESSVTIGGTGTLKGKPILYGGYFEEVVKNPALKEIKVPSPLGRDFWKQYVLSKTTIPGVLNVPRYKLEVEGVTTGARVQLGSNYYFKFMGRNVPIDVGAYFTEGTLGKLNIPSGNIITGAEAHPSSYISTTSYIPSPLTSSGYGLSRIFGSLNILGSSAASYKSSVSKPLSYSKISSLKAKSYKPSVYKSIVSKPYSYLGYNYRPYSLVSYPPRTPPTKVPLVSLKPFGGLFKRIQFKGKAKPKPQRYSQPTMYQASFTAASLGITSKRMPKSKLLGGLSIRPIVKSQRTTLKQPERITPLLSEKSIKERVSFL